MRCEETDEDKLEPVKELHWTLLKESFTASTNCGYITGNVVLTENLTKKKNR